MRVAPAPFLCHKRARIEHGDRPVHNNVYCDEIGNIAITGTIVRFELVTLSASDKDAVGKPQLVNSQTVIMPLDGFLRGAARLQGVVQELEKKGVIKRETPKDTAKRS